MAGREQPYDPYIPAGNAGQGGSAQYEGGNTRTAAIQSVRRTSVRSDSGLLHDAASWRALISIAALESLIWDK